jgi:hypothetical protein
MALDFKKLSKQELIVLLMQEREKAKKLRARVRVLTDENNNLGAREVQRYYEEELKRLEWK